MTKETMIENILHLLNRSSYKAVRFVYIFLLHSAVPEVEEVGE